MYKNICICFLSLFIVACNTTIEPQNVVPNSNLIQSTTPINAAGKVAIIQGKQKLSSYLNITVKKDYTLIYLTTLTGSTIFKLEKNKNQSTITDNEGNIYVGDDATKLVHQLTNLNLPCEYLSEIILAVPSQLNYTANEDGTIKSLVIDAGDTNIYTVKYNSYQVVNNHYMPKNITVENPNLIMRININSWEL